MGTPQFAAPTLNLLLSSEFRPVAVYTKPPKPNDRGQKIQKSLIHEMAEDANIPVYTPASLKSIEEQKIIQDLKPDVIVVVAYGMLLPKGVLEIPKLCINLHPSDLPKWRGAAPIQRTIMSGELSTAVCVMRMDEGMDTGDIILRKPVNFSIEDTSSTLHNSLASIGAEMILESLHLIKNGNATFTKQSEYGVQHANKLTAEDEKINFHQDVKLVHAQIRAFSPKPGAYFTYAQETIKIISADYISTEVHAVPGTVIGPNLEIACVGGILKPTLLQRQGRKMIYTEAFLRGFGIPVYTLL